MTLERYGVHEDTCGGRVTRPRIRIKRFKLSLVRAKAGLSRCVTVDSHLRFLKLNSKMFVV